MDTAQVSINHSLFPRWASLYLFYKNSMPSHRGKAAFLRFLHRIGVRKQQPFVWKMRNGVLLAISPTEGFAPWSVGWMCFEHGVWEPHVERILRVLLKPGDVAMDIGANIGYFSAVMAGCVGPKGKVWSFEPVPPSFERLTLCQRLNQFANMRPLQMALGAEERSVEISYNPVVMGGASIYQEKSSAEIQTARVNMSSLDKLVEARVVTLPDLIKIDVEGHELEAFRGAQDTIRKAKPTIVFEYNTETASKAGWTLADIAALLGTFAEYRYYLLEEKDFLKEIDPKTYSVAYGEYVDVLADAGRVDFEKIKDDLAKFPQ